MAWTKEMVDQLRKMWLDGLTANEIAKKIGVSKNSIVGKVHRLCLQARPSPIKKKEVIETKIIEEDSSIEIIEETSIESEEYAEIEAIEEKSVCDDKKSGTKSENIKLVDLDSHTCRWPIGDPREDDFCFCGKKIKSGQTYCEEHSAMAFVKPQKK